MLKIIVLILPFFTITAFLCVFDKPTMDSNLTQTWQGLLFISVAFPFIVIMLIGVTCAAFDN